MVKVHIDQENIPQHNLVHSTLTYLHNFGPVDTVKHAAHLLLPNVKYNRLVKKKPSDEGSGRSAAADCLRLQPEDQHHRPYLQHGGELPGTDD